MPAHTKTMTPADITKFVAETREVCGKATRPPWEPGGNGGIGKRGGDDQEWGRMLFFGDRNTVNDVDFTCYARAALPRASDIIEELQKDLVDMKMLIDHLTRTYDHFSRGRISKPNTLPEEVFKVAEELDMADIDEELAELRQIKSAAEAWLACSPSKIAEGIAFDWTYVADEILQGRGPEVKK
jgi:hypothetical protein